MRSFCRENKIELLDNPDKGTLRVKEKVYRGDDRWEKACKDWIVRVASTGRPEERDDVDILKEIEAERGFVDLIDRYFSVPDNTFRDEHVAMKCDFDVNSVFLSSLASPTENYGSRQIYAIFARDSRIPLLLTREEFPLWLWKYRLEDVMVMRFTVHFHKLNLPPESLIHGRSAWLGYHVTRACYGRLPETIVFVPSFFGGYTSGGPGKTIGRSAGFTRVYVDGVLRHIPAEGGEVENVTRILSWCPERVGSKCGRNGDEMLYFGAYDGFTRVEFNAERDTVFVWSFGGYIELCPAKYLREKVPKPLCEMQYIRNVFSFLEGEVKTLSITLKVHGFPDKMIRVRGWEDFSSECSALIEGDWIAYKGRTKLKGYRDLADGDEIVLMERGE